MEQQWVVFQPLPLIHSLQITSENVCPFIFPQQQQQWGFTFPAQPVVLCFDRAGSGTFPCPPLHNQPPFQQPAFNAAVPRGSKMKLNGPLENSREATESNPDDIQPAPKNRSVGGRQSLLAAGRRKKITNSRSRNYRQNPSRNIVTNIGNQLITYLSNPHKSRLRLKMICPGFSEDDCSGFFQYVRRIKKETDYYLNAQKLRSFWYPSQRREFQELYHRPLRVISRHYLHDVLPSCILTSTKMKKQTKWHHFRIRNELLRVLQNASGLLPQREQSTTE